MFDALIAALQAVGVPVYHFRAPDKEPTPYIVWGEDGQADAVWADGGMDCQAIQGTADYFTKAEFDPNVGKIRRALDDADISFRLNSIQHEDDTGITHYEWVWEVV